MTITREAEATKVLNWRYKVLRKAGYDKISASLLASSQCDLHLAESMATKVDHHIAVKILT